MPKSLRLLASLFALCATCSAANASTMNLSLNDCGTFGAGGVTSTCSTNSGNAMNMIVSVFPRPGLDHVSGAQFDMSAITAEPVLSPWWQLDGCRTGALNQSADFTSGPFSCIDFWSGLGFAVGGVDPVHPAPNRFNMKFVGISLLGEQAMSVGENYLLQVTVSNIKSTGAGSCAGCNIGACFVLNSVYLTQTPPNADDWITMPATRNWVTYQGGAVSGGCPAATPTQNRTWGQLKALYR